MQQKIQVVIEVMIETYYQDTGHKPAGILLGPKEYRELCHHVRNSTSTLKQSVVTDKHQALITEYRGFPLYVKELPGVELILPYQEAFHAAYR